MIIKIIEQKCVMSLHNSEKYIEECLNLEIVLWDKCSTDKL